MTVARWRSQGWRSLQHEPRHPLEIDRGVTSMRNAPHLSCYLRPHDPLAAVNGSALSAIIGMLSAIDRNPSC